MDLIAQQSATNQQPQAAATADSNQLQSLPLTALSLDDSGPPQMTYDQTYHSPQAPHIQL